MIKRIVSLWHRRIGITSAIVVIFLSLSGLALNHLDSLYKPQTFVSSSWLLNWYQIPLPSSVQRYQVDHTNQENRTSEIVWADGTIFINKAAILFDKQEMLGVTHADEIIYLFLRNELHLFTMEGERIESISLQTSSYTQFDQVLGTEFEQIVGLKPEAEEIHLFNLFDMEFVEGTSPTLTLHDGLNKSLSPSNSDLELARRTTLLKSKVLQDLHSGRFFGRLGPYVMDLFALGFLFLAISGLFIWVKKRQKRARKKRH